MFAKPSDGVSESVGEGEVGDLGLKVLGQGFQFGVSAGLMVAFIR